MAKREARGFWCRQPHAVLPLPSKTGEYPQHQPVCNSRQSGDTLQCFEVNALEQWMGDCLTNLEACAEYHTGRLCGCAFNMFKFS